MGAGVALGSGVGVALGSGVGVALGSGAALGSGVGVALGSGAALGSGVGSGGGVGVGGGWYGVGHGTQPCGGDATGDPTGPGVGVEAHGGAADGDMPARGAGVTATHELPGSDLGGLGAIAGGVPPSGLVDARPGGIVPDEGAVVAPGACTVSWPSTGDGSAERGASARGDASFGDPPERTTAKAARRTNADDATTPAPRAPRRGPMRPSTGAVSVTDVPLGTPRRAAAAVGIARSADQASGWRVLGTARTTSCPSTSGPVIA